MFMSIEIFYSLQSSCLLTSYVVILAVTVSHWIIINTVVYHITSHQVILCSIQSAAKNYIENHWFQAKLIINLELDLYLWIFLT